MKGGTTIGFGASVYDCSFVLAHYLEQYPSTIKDKIVVELGCGPGLASMGSVLCGAAWTVATDGDSVSVDLAEENIVNNNLNALNISCRKLYWGDDEDIKACKDTLRYACRQTEADVILAADVAALPYAAAYGALVQTFSDLLTDQGIVLLCYQRRHASEDEFFELLSKIFHVERLHRSSIHEDFRSSPIFIFSCKRKSNEMSS